MIRRRVIVRGKVQGVFFRATCEAEARSHHLAGWVSNEPDGSVVIELEGDEAGIDATVEWAHEGPAHAQVESVEVVDLDPTGETTFSVR